MHCCVVPAQKPLAPDGVSAEHGLPSRQES
jgi:hypothetical protein